jgi:hypothetical protein
VTVTEPRNQDSTDAVSQFSDPALVYSLTERQPAPDPFEDSPDKPAPDPFEDSPDKPAPDPFEG